MEELTKNTNDVDTLIALQKCLLWCAEIIDNSDTRTEAKHRMLVRAKVLNVKAENIMQDMEKDLVRKTINALTKRGVFDGE